MPLRREYVLGKGHSDAQPRRVLAVAADVDLVLDPAAPTYQVERLTTWSVAGVDWAARAPQTFWQVDGSSAADWWALLATCFSSRDLTWIVADRAVRFLSLVGAWTLIESGKVVIDGGNRTSGNDRHAGRGVPEVRPRGDRPDDRLSEAATGGLREVRRALPGADGTRRRARHDGRGAAAPPIIDDPPTLIDLRAPGQPGTLRICDIRNWGIDCVPRLAGAHVVAGWLRDVMARMVGTLRDRQWGGLAPTVGAQSLRTWRRAYHWKGVRTTADPVVLELEAAALYGGRCECGRIGRYPHPVKVLDVRSSYGSSCAVLAVPVRVRRVGDGALCALPSGDAGGLDCCAEVCLQTPEAGYPVRSKAGVTWPVGRLRTTLAGPELADALAHQRVVSVGRWVQYHTGPALRDYALGVYALRESSQAGGDRALAQWAKALLVCLPGKFGQRGRRWLAAPDARPWAPWLAWWESHPAHGLRRLRSLAGRVERQETDGWAPHACPAVAAWVHSHARMRLLSAMRLVGAAGMLYVDTDCIICPEGAADRLVAANSATGAGMGQWTERARSPWVVIHGVKHYDLADRGVCAGRPAEAAGEEAGPGQWWYRCRFGQALACGRAPGATRELRRWARTRPYTLGRVGPGGRVLPLVREDF